MSIEEVKEKKFEMERKISVAMKEFEHATQLQVGSVCFSRCVQNNEFGIEKDFSYNVKTSIEL